MDTTPRLGLPFIIGGQALKHVTHNESLQKLDALVQPVVESAALATPPSSPVEGEAYLVTEDATDAWAGHDNEIAAFQAGTWSFYDPAEGWQVFDRASDTLKLFSGTNWITVAAIGAGLPHLGINTSADDTNRLAVAGTATLFTHEGNGHQLKLNKATTGDTASLLYQSNWSGRAEMGLMGDDAWRLKVSPDGSSWTDAITVDATTGALTTAGTVRPATDNTHSLGASGARWSAVWASTGTIQTSDMRLKTEIALSDLGLDFILALAPSRFRWTDNSAGDDGQKLHYGLIAQQVREAIAQCNAEDFGGHVLTDPSDPDSLQALRYDQFIAPLIMAIHELALRLDRLEARR
jgi:hypothetical protein